MTSYQEFSDFPAEILSDILGAVPSVQDLFALSSTCHRLRKLYQARKITYLTNAVSSQYGPLEDAIQLVTYNDSQLAHLTRNPPVSQALLKQIVHVGRIAARWEDVYPAERWDHDFEQRRLLDASERFALRRAVYRLWLYAEAFHSPSTPRHARLHAPLVEQRRMLLRNFSLLELAEMFDVHKVMRKVLEGRVCPSDRAIERGFRRRFPDAAAHHQLLFNAPPNPFAPPPLDSPLRDNGLAGFGSALDSMLADHKASRFRDYLKYRPTATYDPGSQGWGDDIGHYYVIEDMMKLNPEQVLWLSDNAVSKAQVQAFIRELGDWFDNNGETFRSTLDIVVDSRGPGVLEFWTDVDYGLLGVAKDGIVASA